MAASRVFGTPRTRIVAELRRKRQWQGGSFPHGSQSPPASAPRSGGEPSSSSPAPANVSLSMLGSSGKPWPHRDCGRR
eukprot:3497230-Pyramimonas_sp.AAC.1